MRVRRREGNAPRTESGALGSMSGGRRRISGVMGESAVAFEQVVRSALAHGAGTADLSALTDAAAHVLGEIDRMAADLQEHPNPANLRAYRDRVAALLTQVLDGAYRVGQSTAFTSGGRRRVYTLVRRVNAALEELARDVLVRNAQPLKLAARLDEIRGWLLDLLG